MVEIKNILCPVDFSSPSRHALDHAVGLATWYGAAITVLHVHPIAVPVLAINPLLAPDIVQSVAVADAERVRTAQTLLEFVKEDTAAAKIETRYEEGLDIADAIVANAKAISADFITLGTNGESKSRKHGLGSVAERVLRTATCPVLNVPARAIDAVPLGPVGFRRIICPIDFSESSRGALDFAAALARDANARLTIAHVVELVSEVAAVAPDFDAHREARLEPARRSMRGAISPVVREWCAVEELLQMGTPHDEILRLADEQHAGLIVMGVRGDGVRDHARLGFTIRQVVPEAPCPVLSVP
jgi:nucleotide-binding universal stress UspA family protein